MLSESFEIMVSTCLVDLGEVIDSLDMVLSLLMLYGITLPTFSDPILGCLLLPKNNDWSVVF